MKPPSPGDVYYGRYEFPAGGSSIKFILVLYSNRTDNRVITCIATTFAVDKNKSAGCHLKTQRFLILANQDYFEKDTYLELLRLKEFTYSDFSSSRTVELKFALNRDLLSQIRECLKKLVNDVPPDLFPLITK